MPGGPSNQLTQEASANVLVVDDEPAVRGLVARWLSAEGYACAQAAEADAALEHLRTSDVHLVTSAITMPGRSGIELLREIRQTYADTEVIMTTGVAQAKAAIEAFTHGASGYLVKPVEREELLFQVRTALERRQLIIDKREYTRKLEEKVRRQTVVIRRSHEETIHRLVVASMCRDEETGAHIKRTGLYSEVLARVAGWSAAEAESIRMAAPMHDVGKIGIPDAILQKPGKLTAEEFQIMKTHTTIGAQMLTGSDSPMLQMAWEIVLNHHERWDGTGYPAGLAGFDIPESARIVAIVDVYDALTHDRVYRPAIPEDEALGMMQQGAGGHFDPGLLALFFAHFSEIRQIARANPDELAKNDMVGYRQTPGWTDPSMLQSVQPI
jgi:putative two-component system response regulator